MPSISDYGLAGLFAVSALSAILPIPTWANVALLLAVRVHPVSILAVLVVGSVIGAVVGYVIGKYGLRRIVPFHNPDREKRAQDWFTRYGALVLLISPWVPFLDDVAPIVAGVENYAPVRFITVVSVSKLVKGIAIVYFTSFFLQFFPALF